MAETLSPVRSAALLDILTHYDTYAEIRDFRYPGSLKHYGPPFTAENGRPSSSPALQTLVSRFLLTLPGLRDLSDDFWKVRVHNIVNGLEEANLSESYDKGVIGSRKTLATAISALIEYPVRGTYGGLRKVKEQDDHYDSASADDLTRAFRDFVDGAVYGSVLEEMVMKAGETDDLAEHSPLTKAVHEYVLVNLASFMHYTLVLSPKGQYLLKLIDNANKLVPYMIIKQTLKIGNVASMMNAMVKVVLAKMSVASVTNWMGLTEKKDEGMNLMQQIISTVLNWDIKDLDSRATKLEKERAQLGKDQLHSLRDYTRKSREEQEKIRKRSRDESVSIVTAILRDADLEWQLTDPHHQQALDYLSIQLSIRDRKEIIQVLCKNSPDHLTQSVRDLVAAYEPVIRRMHEAIDLSGTIGDFEYFLRDMIKLGRIQTASKGSNEAIVPTVGDFAQLLRKHQKASHRFIHQCCKNGPELTSWYFEWAKKTASEFKQRDDPDNEDKSAGDLTQPLTDLFTSLPQDQQQKILPILDSHTTFVNEMHDASHQRLSMVLKSQPSSHPHIAKIFSSGTTTTTTAPQSREASRPPSPTQAPNPTTFDPSSNPQSFKDPSAPVPHIATADPGPGSFLARWQDLLENTAITPLTQKGKIEKATSAAVVSESGRDVGGYKLVELEKGEGASVASEKEIKKEKVGVGFVVEYLGERFREVLGRRGCDW